MAIQPLVVLCIVHTHCLLYNNGVQCLMYETVLEKMLYIYPNMFINYAVERRQIIIYSMCSYAYSHAVVLKLFGLCVMF